VNSLLASLIGLLPCWTTSIDLFIATPYIFKLKKMKVVRNEKTLMNFVETIIAIKKLED